MRWLLIFLCGCRLSWSAWQGAPPRTANEIKLALYAADEPAMTLARSALARDPKLTVVAFDPSVIEKPKTECGSPSCTSAVNAACSWSASQGAEYYAIATVSARYHSDHECTEYANPLDKNPECIESVEKNQASVATYNIDVYDVKTCAKVNALSRQVTTRAAGPEEHSMAEALEQLPGAMPATSEALPEQVAVDEAGRAPAAADGLYALYRGGAYSGYTRVEGSSTTMLHCCTEPRAGDVLVARGERRTVELAVDLGIGTLTHRGARATAGSAGIHLRYYSLAGGLRFGAGADAFSRGETRVVLLTPEIGWGFRVHPALQLSANVGVGAGWAGSGYVDDETTASASPRMHALATLRAETYFATWAFLGADVGYVHTGTFDDWDHSGYEGGDVRVRSPIARFWFGFDL